MLGMAKVDRQRLSSILELLAERLPARLLRPEHEDLSRKEIRELFLALAEHLRTCMVWSETKPEAAEESSGRRIQVTLYCDGASRGNPGPAGAGVLILGQGEQRLLELNRFLGAATNNEAEYQALIMGLQAAGDLGADRLRICLDSELVVKQVRGEYRVRNNRLQRLYGEVMAHLKHFNDYVIVHIGRELNQQADRLANEAIDRGLLGGLRNTVVR
jgi:ribonuclease HI